MWANTTHPIYCAIKSSSLGSGTLKINVHKGSSKDGDVWFRTTMEKIPTTIHKAATGETKDLYYGMIEYVEEGLQEIQFEIWDGDDKREWHSAFSGWWTSPGYTKPVYDYENKNFTTYPASLSEKTSYIYFNAADWTDDYIQLGVGHGLYQGYNQLTNLTNTTLYYGNPSLNYGDAVHITFLGHYENFGTGNNWLTDLTSHADHYAGFLHYSLVENNYYLFQRGEGDDNGAVLSYSHLGSESSSYTSLNKTQTVQARVKATGSSYSDAAFASWPGSVSVERTYMSSASATSTPDAADMGSATTEAVITSSITLTASANSGYYFEGWGDASNSNPTDGAAAKTYTVTADKTSYAFFSQAYTLTYDVKGDYSTSTVTCYSVADFSGATTSGSSIPTGHLITIVATPATGYEVKGWYSDASCETEYSSGSGGVTIESGNNTFKLASLNANTEVYPKFGPKTYTINLANMEADEAGTTSVSVTYNASTNMTSSDVIDKPTKAHYDFGGYYISEDGGITLTNIQLIDADGKWNANVTGYTSNDGAGNPTWVHDYAISLYAKWTKHPYTVNLVVSPAGAGSISPSGESMIGYNDQESSDITATPTNAAWVFKEWQFSKTDEEYDVRTSDEGSYSSTDATIRIKASHNGTLTAVFQKRYELVGSVFDKESNGGMPGWSYDGTGDFTINSVTAVDTDDGVDLSYSCNLTSNTAYIFKINERGGNVYSKGNVADQYYYTLPANTSVELTEYGEVSEVWIQTGDASGQFTFRITKMRSDGAGHYYPTVSIDRPQQVNVGWKYINIGGELTSGDVGGTVAVTKKSDASAVSNGTWLTYGTAVTYTATPTSGYSVTWYNTNDYATGQFSTEYTFDHAGTTTGKGYAKFSEVSNTITINKSGEGTITVAGDAFTWGNTTTCGVTTTRALEATAATGYTFTGWSLSSDPDFQLDDKSGDTDNTVTLKGKGHGTAGTLTANFTPKNYTVTLHDDHGGSNNGSATVDYDATSLSVSSNAGFEGWTLLGYWNTDGNQVTDASGNVQANVSNYTDASSHWKYDNNVTLYAHWSRSVTLDKNGDNGSNGSVTVTYQGSAATPSAASWSGYTVEGYYTNAACTTKVMEANGKLMESVTGYTNAAGKWTKTDATTLYTKWVKRIYRTGDNSGTDESYSGSAIPTSIEFRMKVHEAGKWYSLCLPFTVDSVCVWDDEDGHYYSIVPYYRSGGNYYKGHYVIRTPNFSSGNSIAIANFDDWVDPSSSGNPSANTPYIIQWPNGYFRDKYISFFGKNANTWPNSMTAGDAPTDNSVVNVYGNATMVSGSVAGAYMLDNDYGVGAWLRLDDEDEKRAIPPFECYILASSEVRSKYMVIRRGMTIEDTATGWEQLKDPSEKASKVLIDGQLYIIRGNQIYTIQGTLVK